MNMIKENQKPLLLNSLLISDFIILNIILHLHISLKNKILNPVFDNRFD